MHDFFKVSPKASQAMFGLQSFVNQSGLDEVL